MEKKINILLAANGALFVLAAIFYTQLNTIQKKLEVPKQQVQIYRLPTIQYPTIPDSIELLVDEINKTSVEYVKTNLQLPQKTVIDKRIYYAFALANSAENMVYNNIYRLECNLNLSDCGEKHCGQIKGCGKKFYIKYQSIWACTQDFKNRWETKCTGVVERDISTITADKTEQLIIYQIIKKYFNE
jgi:hypothetical protein